MDLKTQHARCSGRILEGIERVLSRGQYILGPEVAELEAKLAAYVGSGYVLGCSSGSDALSLSLMLRNIGPGDLVFVPAFTFAATVGAVSLCGATACFVDVDPYSYNMDLTSLTRAIEHGGTRGASERRSKRGLRPAAIVAVDLFGQAADYEALSRIAIERGLALIEDGAQSFGALQNGKRVGALCPLTTTSFFPSKPLGCYGDGGAVFCSSREELEILRSLREQGRSQGAKRVERVGRNARLDTLQAAVLLEKLEIFDEELEARREIARKYDELLRNVLEVPEVSANNTSSWAQYTIKLPDMEKLSSSQRLEKRAALVLRLKQEGVPSRVYYERPLHLEPAYEHLGYRAGSLPVSEFLSESVLSLPMHPYLVEEELRKVSEALKGAL